MERVEAGDLVIIRDGPVGFGNNIYVVIDPATNEAAFVDAPGKTEELVAVAESAGVQPRTILLTHSHQDHTSCIDGLKAKYGCRVYADRNEPWLTDGQLDTAVRHGDAVSIGRAVFSVISNPGHTPGSTTFVHGDHAFVGDTLFPGGPGHSRSNELLLQEIESITTQLYALPDGTTIWPGHGERTTIGASKAEYAIFASKPHPPDLHGDVLWLEH
jgi:glyoxylase-like metal-dependent hydrolase (beta-lactamase superfamily II)